MAGALRLQLRPGHRRAPARSDQGRRPGPRPRRALALSKPGVPAPRAPAEPARRPKPRTNEDPASIETGSFSPSGGSGRRSDRLPEAAEDLGGLAAEEEKRDDGDNCDERKDECVLG